MLRHKTTQHCNRWRPGPFPAGPPRAHALRITIQACAAGLHNPIAAANRVLHENAQNSTALTMPDSRTCWRNKLQQFVYYRIYRSGREVLSIRSSASREARRGITPIVGNPRQWRSGTRDRLPPARRDASLARLRAFTTGRPPALWCIRATTAYRGSPQSDRSHTAVSAVRLHSPGYKGRRKSLPCPSG